MSWLAVVLALSLGPNLSAQAAATDDRPKVLGSVGQHRTAQLAEDVPVPSPRPEGAAEAVGTPEENCAKNDADARIDGCTKLIESERLSGDRLASVYAARGYGYLVKRDYNLAILDLNRSLELKPDDAQTLVYRGYAFGLVNDHKNAIADFTRALELDPDNPGTHADRGSAHNAAGNVKDALEDYRRAVELAPEAEYPYSGRAAVYAGQGQDELALADYAKALEIAPKHWRNRRERGSLLLRMGRYRDSIEDFSAAIDRWSSDINSQRDRAIARSMLGLYASALRDLDTAIKAAPKRRSLYRTRAAIQERQQNYEAALADLDTALSLRDTDVDALVRRARILVLKGDLDAGEAAVGKALAVAPDRADAYLARGLLRARSSQPDAAMEDVLVGFGLAPGSDAIAVAGASVLTEIGDPASAIAILTPILERNPEHADALIKRAAARTATGDFADAVSDGRSALVLRPSVEAFFVLAKAYKKTGDSYRAVRAAEGLLDLNRGHAGAVALLEAIAAEATSSLAADTGDTAARLGRSFARLALKPKERPLLEEIFADINTAGEAQPGNALAYLAMAKLKQHVRRNDLAITDYQRAVELDPGLAEAHLQIGLIRTGTKDYWLGFIPFAEAARRDHMLRDKAADTIRQMLVPATMTTRHQPDNVDLLLGLAVGHAMLGEFDQAFPMFEKALGLDSGNAEIYHQRGLARRDSGQRERAIADLEKAVELDPEDVGIRRALEAVRKEDG